MINRRQFLISSAVGTSAVSTLATSPTIAMPSWDQANTKMKTSLSIEECFMPQEWLQAFKNVVELSTNTADLSFLQNLPAMQASSAALNQHKVLKEGNLPLLSLPAPGLEPFTLGLARSLALVSNNLLSEKVRASKGALSGLASVSCFDPNAVQEAERAITQLGLTGVSLGANRGIRLSNQQLWPLYEFAQSVQVPIYIPATYSIDAGDIPYRSIGREGVIAGAAADSSGHASQLIFGGVLDAFPKLNIILARLGEATPHWYGELVAMRSGMNLGDTGAPDREIHEYFRENIYLTTADMTSSRTLEFCNLVFGHNRIFESHYNTNRLIVDTSAGHHLKQV